MIQAAGTRKPSMIFKSATAPVMGGMTAPPRIAVTISP